MVKKEDGKKGNSKGEKKTPEQLLAQAHATVAKNYPELFKAITVIAQQASSVAPSHVRAINRVMGASIKTKLKKRLSLVKDENKSKRIGRLKARQAKIDKSQAALDKAKHSLA